MDCTPFRQRYLYVFDVVYLCLVMVSSVEAANSDNGGGKPFYYQDENGRVMEVRRTGFTLPPVKRQCECYCLIAGDEATIHCCVECHVTDSVCFPANAYVTSENGDVIKMSDLKVGDTILTVSDSGQIQKTEVITFLTYDPNIIGGYIRLTGQSGSSLLLSRSHLVYVSESNRSEEAKPRFAGEVTSGQYMFTKSQDDLIADRIMSIRLEAHKGAYVPLTSHGTLLVNDVMVSSYAAFPHHVAHSFMLPLRWLPFLASYTTPSNGDHHYVTVLKTLGDLVMPWHRYRYPETRGNPERSSDITYGSVGYDVSTQTVTSGLRET